ncbi:MAG: DUF1858 domain-containing protein [Bryobacteraceae bacterium]|nr:DUF1858 domain-containing protein [Bryobacteraceae bacterium]
MTLPITPETKVGALLEAYPALEKVLVGIAPAFAKLRNPILRRTVAKVATLDQAAKIGGVGARELVRTLREAAGQADADLPESAAASPDAGAASGPEWLAGATVRLEIDADAMLETGEHPLGKVRQCAAALGPREVVRLTSSFRPAPLVDAVSRGGLRAHCRQTDGGYVTYVWRA